MIYYGDEAGMWGADDPDDRKPMLWPEFSYEDETYRTVRPDLTESDANVYNVDLYQFYRRLAHLRKNSIALRQGTFNTIFIDDNSGIYVFSRIKNTSTVVVIMNNSEEEHKVNIPVTWQDDTFVQDYLTENQFYVHNGHIMLSDLPEKSAIILIKP